MFFSGTPTTNAVRPAKVTSRVCSTSGRGSNEPHVPCSFVTCLTGGPEEVDGLVGAELELPDEPLPGCDVGDVGLFLDPLDPHALTAISTASAPAEQAK